MSSPRPSLYRRITSSVPLLVTVVVHVIIIAIAGYLVVSESILGNKKPFVATNATENVAQKQVEHRLQIARKGGGSVSTSPVSANRIFSADPTALQMPAPPELNLAGTNLTDGVGFGTGLGGIGSGSGTGTGSGNGSGLSPFMSTSFLGISGNKSNKIVFVVDVGRFMMDIKKGGFLAYSIIRDEIMKLVSRLPPSCEFGLVVYESNGIDRDAAAAAVSTFSETLVPATSANKMRFFKWMTPINTNPDRVGITSVPDFKDWRPKPLPNAGLDPTLQPPVWVRGLHCALVMGADTVFVVAGSPGVPVRKLTGQDLDAEKARQDGMNEANTRGGQTLESITAAREAFLDKVKAQINQLNAKLTAAGKTPIIIPRNPQRIFEDDFIAMLKKKGLDIKLNTKGWASPNGGPIWDSRVNDAEVVSYDEVVTHISKLQRALLRDKAMINIFYLVGQSEQPQQAIDDYSKITIRNGGRFQLITTRKLEEIVAREEAAAAGAK